MGSWGETTGYAVSSVRLKAAFSRTRNQGWQGAEEPSLPRRRPRSRHSGTCGEQAAAAGDGSGIGIVLDGPHLRGEFCGGDHVNASDGQQQDIGGLHQKTGDLAFQVADF